MALTPSRAYPRATGALREKPVHYAVPPAKDRYIRNALSAGEDTLMAGRWEDGTEDGLSAIASRTLASAACSLPTAPSPQLVTAALPARPRIQLILPLKRCSWHGESSSFGALADIIPRAYYEAVRLCAGSLQEVQ